jgi:hypothetical protein
VADLVVLAVREQGRRPHADPTLRGATKIVALRGIQLARLAKVIANLVWSRTSACGGITTVALQRRAVQIGTKLQLRVNIFHHLALLLRSRRPDADTSLNLSTVRIQPLRDGADTTLSRTPDVLTRRLALKGEAERVVEGVLCGSRSRRQGLSETGTRNQKTACSFHSPITSFLHV